MKYNNIFAFDMPFNIKTISLFVILAGLPNLLGLLNITTPWGFNIHFFQIAIFLAALIYGPIGGLTSGLFGSFYSAIMMHNPYIIVGNMILGFFVGYFARKYYTTWQAVLMAFAIQLPWLVATDLYLVHMPAKVIFGLVVALAISNTAWAIVAQYIKKPIRNAVL
jgi:uncharacterized membrane protein